MKNATRLAVCGIVAALSVVLLFLGGISFVLAYIMPMLVGLLTIIIKRTFSSSAAWITYTAVSLLSFILVADKECVLMYIMFFGFYPIVFEALNRIKPAVLKVVCKFAIFNVLMLAVQLLLIYVFGIPFLQEGEGKIIILFFALILNLLYVIYDKLLANLVILYAAKVEKTIKNILK